VFPATRIYFHRETGQRRRHHLHESVLQRVMNRRTAKAIGLTIPPSLLQRADQIID
jgi:hypothetical protein